MWFYSIVHFSNTLIYLFVCYKPQDQFLHLLQTKTYVNHLKDILIRFNNDNVSTPLFIINNTEE